MYLIKVHTTGSTNDDLKDLIRQTDVESFTCIWALHQTQGRGQMGNTWDSESGKNLTFSILIKEISLDVSNQFTLNKVVSLALKEVLNTFYPLIQIKWANDILADNQKIAGILIENIIKGNKIKYSIVGIGINVNQTHFDKLPNATSLKLKTGKEFDLEMILKKIVNLIEFRISEIDNYTQIHTDYLQHLFGYKMTRKYTTNNNEIIEGQIIGVSRDGKLQIQTDNFHIYEYELKEIRFEY